MHELETASHRALDALEMFYQCEAFVPSGKTLSDEQMTEEKNKREKVYMIVEDAIVQLRRALRNYRIYAEKNERST